MNIFLFQLFQAPRILLPLALLIIFSITLHELVHAWAALKQGDSTAADRGHLTLNPLKQMGPVSLLMFALCGVAWGAVPVNPANFRHKYSASLVAAAGPLTNLVLALILALGAYGAGRIDQLDAALVLFLAASLNVVLFILNMLPLPGLDGWSVYRPLLPVVRLPDSEWLKGFFLTTMLMVFIFIDKLFKLGQMITGEFLNFLQYLLG